MVEGNVTQPWYPDNHYLKSVPETGTVISDHKMLSYIVVFIPCDLVYGVDNEMVPKLKFYR